MILIFRLIIRRDIWIFYSKVFSSELKTLEWFISAFLIHVQKIKTRRATRSQSQTSINLTFFFCLVHSAILEVINYIYKQGLQLRKVAPLFPPLSPNFDCKKDSKK